jgi:hypothetical protein
VSCLGYSQAEIRHYRKIILMILVSHLQVFVKFVLDHPRRPQEATIWGSIVLVFSGLALVGMGFSIVGSILGIIGGITMLSTSKRI